MAEKKPAEVKKRILGRAEILGAEDLEIKEVPVPEWGGPGAVVLVRNLSGAERDQFEADTVRFTKGGQPIPNLENTRARLVAMAACDEHGAAIFSAADVRRLTQKSARPLDRLFEAASKLSGLSPADIEGLVQSFTRGPSAGSGST